MIAAGMGIISVTPVGWAAAGAGVLAYGAWSLGNLAWDHREQIGQFMSDSASWVGDKATDAWNATSGAVSDATDWAGDKLSDVGSAAEEIGDKTLDVVSFGLL